MLDRNNLNAAEEKKTFFRHLWQWERVCEVWINRGNMSFGKLLWLNESKIFFFCFSKQVKRFSTDLLIYSILSASASVSAGFRTLEQRMKQERCGERGKKRTALLVLKVPFLYVLLWNFYLRRSSRRDKQQSFWNGIKN